MHISFILNHLVKCTGKDKNGQSTHAHWVSYVMGQVSSIWTISRLHHLRACLSNFWRSFWRCGFFGSSISGMGLEMTRHNELHAFMWKKNGVYNLFLVWGSHHLGILQDFPMKIKVCIISINSMAIKMKRWEPSCGFALFIKP